MGRVILKSSVLLIAFLLAGCGPGTKLGSIAGGECALPGVHTPPYKVLGKRPYDQNWVDDTTEGLVRGCNQPRPLARPASLDAPKIKAKPRPKPKAPLPPKRPATPVASPPVAPAAPVAPAPPPATAQPINPPVLETAPSPDLVPTPKRRWWQR